MKRALLASAFAAAALLATDTAVYAQFDAAGPGSIGGVGGLPGAVPRTGRLGPPRLMRNQSPVISPYINLLPGFANSFEGQYLLRTVPFEQFYNNVQSTSRSFQYQQMQIDANRRGIEALDTQIRTGVATTGKPTQFMNSGRYYPGR